MLIDINNAYNSILTNRYNINLHTDFDYEVLLISKSKIDSNGKLFSCSF